MGDEDKAAKKNTGKKTGEKTAGKGTKKPVKGGAKKTVESDDKKTAGKGTKKSVKGGAKKAVDSEDKNKTIKKTVKRKKTVRTKTIVKPMKAADGIPARNIGISVKPPRRGCEDVNCPFHGKLPVRGQILEGIVTDTKMDKTAVIKKERLFFIKKYERYEKRTSRYSAHNPPCLKVKTGDEVKIAECRPLSKTVSFVIIERRSST